MTARDDFDRLLISWLDDEAPSREPEHLLENVLARTARTARRPAWLASLRWIPMQATMRLPAWPRPNLVFALLALLLLAAMLAIAIGSRPHLPAPFGLARNGSIAFMSSGDIFTTNPDGTGAKAITSGAATDMLPSYSRDGTRIAYWSTEDESSFKILVISQNGGDTLTIADGVAEPSEVIDWSPDGRQVTYSGKFAGSVRVATANVDGSGQRLISSPDVRGHDPSWSPDGSLIVFGGGNALDGYGLFAVHPDGTGERRIIQITGQGEHARALWSPDGTRLLYSGRSMGRGGDIRTINPDGTEESILAFGQTSHEWPTWSSDGSWIAFILETPDGKSQVAVMRPDGSDLRVLDPYVWGFYPQWSPDGKQLFAVNGADAPGPRILVLDPFGKSAPVVIQMARLGSPQNASWQRLAP